MQTDQEKMELHRKVWQLTWPMILSNISTPLLGLVDTAIMGHLNDSRYLAAVAVGASLFSTLIWSVAFLKASTTGLTAQFFGQSKSLEVKTTLIQAAIMSAIIAMLFLLLQQLLLTLAIAAFSPPDDVVNELIAYFNIRIWGFPASLFTFVVIGWYIGQQNTYIPMMLAVTTNVVNACLNWVLVYQFDMGVSGVAYGTIISEYFSLLLACIAISKTLRKLPGDIVWPRLFKWESYRELSHANVNYFIRTLFLMGTFIFFTRQGALMGKDMLAVNELLKNFLLIIALALDGYAHAAEALTGAAWGSRRRTTFFNTIRVITIWSVITASILSLLFYLGGTLLVSVLTDLPNLVELANHYILWIIPLPIISVWCFLFDGIFIGTTKTKAMRNNMIFSSLFVFLPLWYLLQPLGNHGLWFALWGFFIARGIGLAITFYRQFYLHDWKI